MAENGTTFNCYHYHRIRSIDSFHFLAAPLASLAIELGDSCKTEAQKMFEFAPLWEYVHNRWINDTLERQKYIFNLLQRKQYFPYTYISSLDILRETQLPNCETWNKGFQLKDKLTNEEVATAHEVFNDLNCTNIEEYLEIYLCVDTLLLTAG